MKRARGWGAWLAQLENHGTLNLELMSLSPTLGVPITYMNKHTFKKEREKSKGQGGWLPAISNLLCALRPLTGPLCASFFFFL